MPIYINYLGTAVPKYKVDQATIAAFMSEALHLDTAEQTRLEALYRATGIKSRYSVLPDYGKPKGQYDFYPNTSNLEPFPTTASRMQVFKKEAVKLAIEATKNAVPGDFELSKITHLVTVSCTGMYAPGLDVEIIEYLQLPTDTRRTAINFMGCYGAFNGLKVARHICDSEEDAMVLVVAVELCTIHFQRENNDDNLLSNSLFGDGAAATVISNKDLDNASLLIEGFYSDIFLNGKEEMKWDVGDFGFQMKLSAKVPAIIKGGIKELTNKLLRNLPVELKDISFYAIHPGGKKILKVIEEVLDLAKADNQYAYAVLRNYGNMSSPTILFVLADILKNITEENTGNHILSFAFGPGLTLESMLLSIHHPS